MSRNRKRRHTGFAHGAPLPEPPYNREIEAAVVGAILLEPGAMAKAIEFIDSPDLFHDQQIRAVFSVCLELFDKNEPIDLMTVWSKTKGHPEWGITVDFLAVLQDSTPTTANIRVHARIVRELSALRDLLDAALTIADSCGAGIENPEYIVREAEERILDIHSRFSVDATVKPSSAYVRDIAAWILKAYRGEVIFEGLPTGFHALDQRLGGLRPKQLSVIAARPAVGKTALMANIAEHITEMILNKGADELVLIVSLEMPAQQVLERIMFGKSNVIKSNAEQGIITATQYASLNTTATTMDAWPLYLSDASGQGVSHIRATAQRIMAQTGKKVACIMIDYLQIMEGRQTDYRDNEASRIGRTAQDLKDLAKDLNCHVLALAQLSREFEQRASKVPMLSDLAQSSGIEKAADVIAFLHREDTNPAADPASIGFADIIIGKNRDGALGQAKLKFIKHLTRFENLPEHHGEHHGASAGSPPPTF